MPQSIASLHTHIVFSTKDRAPFINDAISEQLFGYIGATCHAWESQPIQVGGWRDHVHILCAHSRKIAVMKLVQEIKSGSSYWFKEQYDGDPDFYWQLGYAALSVTPRDSDKIAKYILNQQEHHANLSYQDECRAYFKEQGLEFDERYFWD